MSGLGQSGGRSTPGNGEGIKGVPQPSQPPVGQSGGPTCGADWVSEYWGGCHAPSRFRIERPGDGYEPAEACPAHLADMIAYMADGDDVPFTVHIRFDEPGQS